MKNWNMYFVTQEAFAGWIMHFPRLNFYSSLSRGRMCSATRKKVKILSYLALQRPHANQPSGVCVQFKDLFHG